MMNDFFKEAIETLEILVLALCGNTQVFDKKSIYKMPVRASNYLIYDKRLNRDISPAFHRKILQE